MKCLWIMTDGDGIELNEPVTEVGKILSARCIHSMGSKCINHSIKVMKTYQCLQAQIGFDALVWTCRNKVLSRSNPPGLAGPLFLHSSSHESVGICWWQWITKCTDSCNGNIKSWSGCYHQHQASVTLPPNEKMSDEQIKIWSKYQSARENAKKRRALFRQWKNKISLLTLVVVAVIILIQRLTQ